jgi:hypothetical protein
MNADRFKYEGITNIILDGLVRSRKISLPVIPAKAGIVTNLT